MKWDIVSKRKRKWKAWLSGGPHDGETIELDEAHPKIDLTYRRDGKKGKAKYKLISETPALLRYEFSK